MATLDDIGGVGSLFGLTPSSLNAQREQQYMDFATKVANAEAIRPGAGSVLGANIMGARGVEQLGSMFGIESPEQKLAKLRQAASQQFDTNTPEGLAQVAQFLNAQGDAAGARQAVMAAQAQQQQVANLQKTQAQTQQAEAGKVIQVDLGDRIQLVNALTREVIREIPKGLTPAQAAKAAKGDGEGGIGQPGPVGKAGAYRDINGNILGASEMKVIRQEFEGAQKLLNTLNQITESDVTNAESFVDWTTKAESKALASEKTLSAQTKIAASQLLEQINQLPPGSASDADMRAAMKSFPGYSNPKALAEWVNRTKSLLQFSINRGQDQFGFKARVQPTAPLDLGKKPAAKTNQSDDALINKYLKPRT